MTLEGKRALVTGAGRASGLGRGIALALARDGASVAVSYKGERRQAEATVEAIEQEGAKAIALRADLAEPQGCHRLVADVVDVLGGVDIVVSNAGTRAVAPFLELSADDWAIDIAVNLSGVFHTCQAAAREMVRAGGGGRIVVITSCSARLAAPSGSSYAAAKAGAEALMRAMAYELAEYGITVNAVAPGPAGPTDLNRDLAGTPSGLRATEASIPLGRLASPEDVGQAVRYLVSPAASLVTGISLGVDGGYTLGKDQAGPAQVDRAPVREPAPEHDQRALR